MHGLAHRGSRLLLASSALLLASCSPLRPALLVDTMTIELAEGEPAHVMLHLNTVAIAQADLGLFLDVDGTADGTPVLEVVPDDPSLDELLSTGVVPSGSGATRLNAHLEGGEIGALCPAGGECDIGVTLTLTGNETPASFVVRFGARRDTDRGLFGGSGQFDAQARADVFED